MACRHTASALKNSLARIMVPTRRDDTGVCNLGCSPIVLLRRWKMARIRCQYGFQEPFVKQLTITRFSQVFLKVRSSLFMVIPVFSASVGHSAHAMHYFIEFLNPSRMTRVENVDAMIGHDVGPDLVSDFTGEPEERSVSGELGVGFRIEATSNR